MLYFLKTDKGTIPYVYHKTPATRTLKRADMDNERCTYGVVNGIQIKKIALELKIYPEIEEQVKMMVKALEEVYELAITTDHHRRDDVKDAHP